eukprot:Phypoly_transcript_13186.p1 GENE.Phypoly_transcript_13186~~Phypoly_transcript_13186.p1  ORF type:complete len:193 (+),score=10.99 Phypoly_transcript_13186:27-581(+)
MSNICAGCNKRVYAAEWVGPISDKYWHKLCLTCRHCNKPLQLGQFSEHAGLPYCNSDYNRLFAIKGFGHGDNNNSIDAPPAAVIPEAPTIEESTTGAVETPVEQSENQEQTLFPTGCPRCGKKVYFNEKTVFNSKEWHQKCFHCTNCKKGLYGGQFNEHNGWPYCKRCHESKFGAKKLHSIRVI